MDICFVFFYKIIYELALVGNEVQDPKGLFADSNGDGVRAIETRAAAVSAAAFAVASALRG